MSEWSMESETDRMLRRLAHAQPPAGMQERVLRRLQQAEQAQTRSRRWQEGGWLALAAAVLVAAVAIAGVRRWSFAGPERAQIQSHRIGARSTPEVPRAPQHAADERLADAPAIAARAWRRPWHTASAVSRAARHGSTAQRSDTGVGMVSGPSFGGEMDGAGRGSEGAASAGQDLSRAGSSGVPGRPLPSFDSGHVPGRSLPTFDEGSTPGHPLPSFNIASTPGDPLPTFSQAIHPGDQP